MTTDRTAPGAARIVKTARQQYTFTLADVSAQEIDVDVPFDSPFVSLDYTCTWSIEVIDPANAGDPFMNGFSRSLDKVTVSMGNDGVAQGMVAVIHVIAIHD